MPREHINELSLEEQVAWYKKKLVDKNLIINSILESTLAGYWDWRIQENTEYLSPTFKKMFGYEDHEMENSPEAWQKIIHPDDLQVVLSAFDAHVESRGTIPFRTTPKYYHKNGNIVNVLCQGHVVEWDKDWKPIRMIGAHIDISPLKQIEEKLSARSSELQDFAYATSHDLKEPLRTISSFIELMRQPDIADKEKNQFMDIVHQAANRMTELIQGLLDHSRIGKELTASKISINTKLDEVCMDLKHSIDNARATILYPKDLPTITAYSSALGMLFQNLISNAIKFRTDNTDPEINISYQEDNQYHIFHIKDNGIGIPANKQNKIFDLFTRLHSSESYEGIGIGLTHCKKIAQLHKGRIEVSESSSSGSTFTVYINRTL